MERDSPSDGLRLKGKAVYTFDKLPDHKGVKEWTR